MPYVIKPALIKKLQNKATRRTLMNMTECTELTVRRWLSLNAPDGPLTALAKLELFEKLLGTPFIEIVQKVK